MATAAEAADPPAKRRLPRALSRPPRPLEVFLKTFARDTGLHSFSHLLHSGRAASVRGGGVVGGGGEGGRGRPPVLAAFWPAVFAVAVACTAYFVAVDVSEFAQSKG